jgi:hypothetical protein
VNRHQQRRPPQSGLVAYLIYALATGALVALIGLLAG